MKLWHVVHQVIALTASLGTTAAFQGVSVNVNPPSALSSTRLVSLRAAPVGTEDVEKTIRAVSKLKGVLEREYVSFFAPMQKEYYALNVSFDDPMTSLSGVDAYQKNVDMLASRTLMGKILFEDAGISLHSVEGGEVAEDGSISKIITRWTLRVTASILPWKPTARFSGISVYEVSSGGEEGVLVDHQTDYWDSINIKPGSNGEYQKVDKGIALQDFLGQVKPENARAIPAGPEVPYQLLRRGNGYEVRRYPSYTVAKIPYDRRDEGYDILATITQGTCSLHASELGTDRLPSRMFYLMTMYPQYSFVKVRNPWPPLSRPSLKVPKGRKQCPGPLSLQRLAKTSPQRWTRVFWTR